jgi:hypothetical protein
MVSGTRDTLPPRDNFAVHLYDKIQKGITRGILRFLFEILRFLFVYVVFNKTFLLKMRKSKKLPLEAEANQRKLFTWTKVVPPTGVTLFRKQGDPTSRDELKIFHINTCV